VYLFVMMCLLVHSLLQQVLASLLTDLQGVGYPCWGYSERHNPPGSLEIFKGCKGNYCRFRHIIAGKLLRLGCHITANLGHSTMPRVYAFFFSSNDATNCHSFADNVNNSFAALKRQDPASKLILTISSTCILRSILAVFDKLGTLQRKRYIKGLGPRCMP